MGQHGPTRMNDDVLEAFVSKYIASQAVPEVGFAWQGGEPTLMGLDFFRKAVNLQKRYAQGKQITNSIQTNGTLLTDEWCEFFAANGFSGRAQPRWPGRHPQLLPRGSKWQADVRRRDARAEAAQETRGRVQHPRLREQDQLNKAAGCLSVLQEAGGALYPIHSQ